MSRWLQDMETLYDRIDRAARECEDEDAQAGLELLNGAMIALAEEVDRIRELVEKED